MQIRYRSLANRELILSPYSISGGLSEPQINYSTLRPGSVYSWGIHSMKTDDWHEGADSTSILTRWLRFKRPKRDRYCRRRVIALKPSVQSSDAIGPTILATEYAHRHGAQSFVLPLLCPAPPARGVPGTFITWLAPSAMVIFFFPVYMTCRDDAVNHDFSGAGTDGHCIYGN